MTEQKQASIISGATLWIHGKNGANLYVKPNITGYDWIMVSPNNGNPYCKTKRGLSARND